MSPFPVESAHRLSSCPEERRWLIEGLWADQAVGIVGGEPKCCKSFLALDMAIAVASGTSCLRRFRTTRRGRVLLFAAEDALHVVKERLEGIARAAEVDLREQDIQVITAPSIRLDLEEDRGRLWDTIDALRPTLLVLDPFVRLHRIDENVSGEVAPLLAHLRDLQRRFNVAVAVVHHAKKGAGKARAGQALRGSSEFHAWGDSNLYLRRHAEQLVLSIEHRAAPSTSGISIALKADGSGLALSVCDGPSPPPAAAASPTSIEHVERALADASCPRSVAELRASCRIRTQKVTAALAALVRAGRVTKTDAGFALTR